MFSRIEQEILKWFQRKFSDTALDRQIESAKLTEREWTKVGFYVNFQVNGELDKCAEAFPITGPSIRSKDIHLGGGSLLWGEGGYLNCLELYAYGDFFKEEIEDFEIFEGDFLNGKAIQ